MKKIFTPLLLLVCGTLIAQDPNRIPLHSDPLQVQKPTPAPSQMLTQSFYTDYDYMDEVYNVDTLGGVYSRFLWLCNMNYDLALGDTNFLYPVVDFSAFYDSYNASGPVPVTNATIGTYTVDSVFIYCGHENNSGNPDTIITKIVALDVAGYPTSTVLHSDTMIATQFGNNDWLSPVILSVPIGYSEANGAARFAVQVEYYGARTDTFAVVAGFGDLGSGQCAQIPNLYFYALTSHYAVNSYRYDMAYSPTYGTLPTATGIDLYYECDGTMGNQGSMVDAQHYLQNWGIWTHITTDSIGLGMQEEHSAIQLGQNIPNPAVTGTTRINYQLANSATNVTLDVYDVTGALIETVNQGQKGSGEHNIVLNTANYASGVYFYTLNVDGVKVTRKMVIGE